MGSMQNPTGLTAILRVPIASQPKNLFPRLQKALFLLSSHKTVATFV